MVTVYISVTSQGLQVNLFDYSYQDTSLIKIHSKINALCKSHNLAIWLLIKTV